MNNRQHRMANDARLNEYDRSLDAFFEIEDALDELREKQKQDQEPFTVQQSEIREELKECGLSLKVFNEMVRRVKAERQKVRREAKMEPSDLHELDVLQEGLASLEDAAPRASA